MVDIPQYSPPHKQFVSDIAAEVRRKNGHGHGNGRTDILKWLAGLALTAIVAYFTAIGAIKEQVAEVKATENAHFGEVLRALNELRQDMREMRGR